MWADPPGGQKPSTSWGGGRGERRVELGLSQMALAEKIELHFSFVSSVERGERNLSLDSLLCLARGLDLDPGVLVEGLRWQPKR